MREESLIRRVETLVTSLNFDGPFSRHLREHFRKNPQMGARDRRMTREWCFNYLRIGRAAMELPFRIRLAIACYLCNTSTNSYLSYLLKDTLFTEEKLEEKLDDKLKEVIRLYPDFRLEDIFPMLKNLSPEIPHTEWFTSFLVKPRVWVRIRKQYIKEVIDELQKLELPFEVTEDPLIISFLPDVQLEKTDSYVKGYFEIQDINSQKSGLYFNPSDNEKWWDACSGSGGKSLMLSEQAADIHIIATDVRPAILFSYRERMKKAGHYNFDTQVFDFDPPGKKQNLNLPAFDGVIADVPCSGSGTWARSPEWNQINVSERLKDYFIPLQRIIVSRTLESLKAGRPLIYITCSVFAEENEENVRFFELNLPLKLEKYAYLKGFTFCADTLFVARFIRK